MEDLPDGDHSFLPAKVCLEDEPFQGDEQKLGKRNQVATSWKLSDKEKDTSKLNLKKRIKQQQQKSYNLQLERLIYIKMIVFLHIHLHTYKQTKQRVFTCS